MRDDDDEKPGENCGSTRATSVETNSGPATPHDPPSPETQARLSISSPHPTIKPMDRLTSPSAALLQQPCKRDGGEDGGIAAVVADPSSASPSPLFQPSPAATSMLEGDWEIRKIVSKRRVGRRYQYQVWWKDTWLPKSELGNAQQLLKEFEARYRAQRG